MIKIDEKENRIGLALSGGGYRATAFHLGVLQKLDQMGLLDKVDLLSCVSGGSIAGAYYALYGKKGLGELEQFLKTKSIAVGAFFGGMLDPFETRLDKLTSAYDEFLFKNKTLNDLDKVSRIYLNATNLATGNMFFFVSGSNGQPELGEHELGTRPAVNFKISEAVAASSAFPPVFPPLRLDRNTFDAEEIDYVTLTDGGVYDNLGVNPLFSKRNNLDILIVSDAGKPFTIDDTPTTKGAMVLKESINILMEQVRGLQFNRLLLHHKANGPKPIWFSIDSVEGELQNGDAAFASSITTNLKKLPDIHYEVLVRHAGALIESRIKRYLPSIYFKKP